MLHFKMVSDHQFKKGSVNETPITVDQEKDTENLLKTFGRVVVSLLVHPWLTKLS